MTTFIENQEANIAKIEEKRSEIGQLLKRGEKLEGQADCPDFLKEQVKGLSELFVDTEKKAKLKLDVLKSECLGRGNANSQVAKWQLLFIFTLGRWSGDLGFEPCCCHIFFLVYIEYCPHCFALRGPGGHGMMLSCSNYRLVPIRDSNIFFFNKNDGYKVQTTKSKATH